MPTTRGLDGINVGLDQAARVGLLLDELLTQPNLVGGIAGGGENPGDPTGCVAVNQSVKGYR